MWFLDFIPMLIVVPFLIANRGRRRGVAARARTACWFAALELVR
jgi:hypothetical protein